MFATRIAAIAMVIAGVASASAQTVYWADRGPEEVWAGAEIRRANLSGAGSETLAGGMRDAFGIALDPANLKVYWTNPVEEKIRRADLDGGNAEDIIVGASADGAVQIALDLSAGKMYWTGRTPSARMIRRANLDGSNIEDLVEMDPGNLWDIALDPAGGKMYFTALNLGTIGRANLDGSSVEYLLLVGTGRPVGLALDIPAGKMYWSSSASTDDARLLRANLDGTVIETILTSNDVHSMSDLALDLVAGKVYWTDNEFVAPDTIRRANLDGSNIENLGTLAIDPEGIALDLRGQNGPPIPTLSEWGLTAMALLVLAAATIAFKRLRVA